MVASVDVPSTIDSCEPLDTGGGEEEEEEDGAAMEEVNLMMQRPVPAGSYCEVVCNNINTQGHT